jgi:hypothetical protein
MAAVTTPIYDDLCDGIKAAEGWIRVREAHELARMIDRGEFDMTTCLRCGLRKAADGDDWCARCEDEDAAQALAALRGDSDG